MSDQEILDNAPDGATHWDGVGYIDVDANVDNYFSAKRSKWWHMSELVLETETRSLSDIARIVELEKEKQAIVEQHDMWKNQWHELNCSLLSRDLEQQLQILKKYANTCGVLRKEPSTRDLHELIMELESQAKALKEQGE